MKLNSNWECGGITWADRRWDFSPILLNPVLLLRNEGLLGLLKGNKLDLGGGYFLYKWCLESISLIISYLCSLMYNLSLWLISLATAFSKGITFFFLTWGSWDVFGALSVCF